MALPTWIAQSLSNDSSLDGVPGFGTGLEPRLVSVRGSGAWSRIQGRYQLYLRGYVIAGHCTGALATSYGILLDSLQSGTPMLGGEGLLLSRSW